MAAEKKITHKGRVIEVTRDKVSVEIISQSACSACHAASLCSMSEAVRKIVEVPVYQNAEYIVGEEVDVLLAPSMGLKAVLLAYVLPLVVLVVLCVSLSFTSLGELYVGLAGLGAVAVYYMILYLIRGRFEKEYVFTIEKKTNIII